MDISDTCLTLTVLIRRTQPPLKEVPLASPKRQHTPPHPDTPWYLVPPSEGCPNPFTQLSQWELACSLTCNPATTRDMIPKLQGQARLNSPPIKPTRPPIPPQVRVLSPNSPPLGYPTFLYMETCTQCPSFACPPQGVSNHVHYITMPQHSPSFTPYRVASESPTW